MFFLPMAGALSDRFGARIVVLAGFIITTAVPALLCLMKSNSIAHKVLLALLLVVIGKSLISPEKTTGDLPVGQDKRLVSEIDSTTASHISE